MKKLHHVVALSLTVLSTVGIAAAHALADDAPATQTITAQTITDTWFQPQPTCSIPLVGCESLPLPAVNPYGAGTLHIAVAGGQATARSYLQLKAQSAPAGTTLTGAQLVVPLDTATAGNGSMSPETSHVQVCTAMGALTDTEGEFDDPPATTCAEYAELTYSSAGGSAKLTGDLSPLLDVLASGLPSGTLDLALLPDNVQTTDAWHDVFSSITRTSPPTAPASLTLTYSSAASPAAGSPSEASSSTPTNDASLPTTAARTPSTAPSSTVALPAGSLGLPAALPPVAVATAGPASEPAPQVAATRPTVESGTTVTTTPVSSASPIAGPTSFLYPAVLLLPGILLLAGYLVINLMTRDLAPPEQ